jgi:hypothetical protein
MHLEPVIALRYQHSAEAGIGQAIRQIVGDASILLYLIAEG